MAKTLDLPFLFYHLHNKKISCSGKGQGKTVKCQAIIRIYL
jgi:hypothetical protein